MCVLGYVYLKFVYIYLFKMCVCVCVCVACIRNTNLSDVEAYGKAVYKDNGVWMLCPKGENEFVWEAFYTENGV